ncbi:neural cell adhesion molecule 1-like isoform X5 [Eriocheir sinensis]|uniref:neural cell adhesion molecule 1-like isoform X5 n=1 Tax=Eriocheir sinensis TaxID=95602 RepID=UPI0021C9CC2B|nr:neural cell adhesion molecule 1-like isoform X5 [Eriocheir sinensis]
MADLDTLFCGTTTSSLHIHGLQEEDKGTYMCRAENRDLDTLFCGTTSSSLHIHGLQEEDEGTYRCWAENREDSLDAVAHIQVQVAPRFLRQPANALAYEKENVELECSVYGQPEPSLHWLKDGELLVETDFCDECERQQPADPWPGAPGGLRDVPVCGAQLAGDAQLCVLESKEQDPGGGHPQAPSAAAGHLHQQQVHHAGLA